MSMETSPQLIDIVHNTLIHLYLAVSQTQSFVPSHTRNQIISKYLKPKLKSRQFKAVKPEIKMLLLTGKKKNADLEAKLLELREILEKKDTGGAGLKADVDRLFAYLAVLHEQHNIDSKMFDENIPIVSDCLYLYQHELEQNINDNGTITAALNMIIQADNVDMLMSVVREFGFQITTQGVDAAQSLHRLQLHQ
ncbi:DUF2913 family protein [Photobacterium leiognathi]|uniref:DUF2913 family protein n=1 Tax=Photobacterium leiognathi TaxID=553611 RepID=UPI002735C80D|nr:DUF2913 family protein [Photobacterium leiognathi]